MSIHIGNIIKKYLVEKGINKSELARRINTTPQNVYGIIKRKSIDTDLLQKISIELGFNFFIYFIPEISKGTLVLEEESGEYKVKSSPKKQEVESLKKEVEYLKEINTLLKKKK
jgi:transcriptional regulator with XRE-family HTH domain